MNGDQAGRAGPCRVAQARGDLRRRQAQLAGADGLGLHQLAILGAHGHVGGDAPFLVVALVDRHDSPALAAQTKHAQHLLRVRPQPPDQPRLIGVIVKVNLGQPGQDAVARAQGRVAPLGDDQDAGAVVHPLLQRRGVEVAVRIGRQHLQDGDGGQHARFVEAAVGFFDHPFALQRAQQALQLHPPVALDAEGFGDVALGRQAGVFRNPLADCLFRREFGHGACLA